MQLNTEIVGISVDSKFTHLQWTSTDRKQGGVGKLNYSLVSDITHKIANDYGVLIDHGEDNGIAFRASIIIDPKGIVRQITINDLPAGRSTEETMRLIQALQYADSHDGEACPMNWKPGKDNIKADPKGAKEYFAKNN